MSAKRQLTPYPHLKEFDELVPERTNHEELVEGETLVDTMILLGAAMRATQEGASKIMDTLTDATPRLNQFIVNEGRRDQLERHLYEINDDLQLIVISNMRARMHSILVALAERLNMCESRSTDNLSHHIVNRLLASNDPFPIQHHICHKCEQKAQEATAADQLLHPDIEEAVAHLQTILTTVVPPITPMTFHPPQGYSTLKSEGEKDNEYWRSIVHKLLSNHTNDNTTYNNHTHFLFKEGPPHAPLWIGLRRVDKAPLIGGNKKDLARALGAAVPMNE